MHWSVFTHVAMTMLRRRAPRCYGEVEGVHAMPQQRSLKVALPALFCLCAITHDKGSRKTSDRDALGHSSLRRASWAG